MTDSANDRALDERRLANAADLYRDLSEALTAQLAVLRRHGAADDLGKTLQDHHRALQTVLDYEARLGRRNGTIAGGGALELDLAAARAEILARLARRDAEGGG